MEGEHRDEPHNGHKAPAFSFDPRLDLVRAPPQPVLDPVRRQGAGQEKRHGGPHGHALPTALAAPTVRRSATFAGTGQASQDGLG